jgi:hypothetical protein
MMSEQVEPPPQEGEDATPPALITPLRQNAFQPPEFIVLI